MLGVVLLVLCLVVVYPLGIIVALNWLGFAVALTFKSWLGAFLLLLLFGSSSGVNLNEE